MVRLDGRTFTKYGAVSYAEPSISGWSTSPTQARRWANTTEDMLDDALQYTLTISGSNFGGPSLSSLVTAKVGGRPCVSTSVISDTEISCVVPDGIGSGHVVSMTLAGRTTSATASTFSYAAPEIHAVSLPSSYNASVGKGWDAKGGQTLTVLGLNFGSTKWNSASGAAVDVQGGTDITVTVGGKSCISVTRVNDRKLTCTAPAGSGPLGHVAVNVAGQSATSAAGGSEDSRTHLASVDSSADDTWHNLGLRATSWVQADSPVSVFNVSAPTITSITYGSSTLQADSATAILLPADGTSKTLTIAGTDFGTLAGSKPIVLLGSVEVPASAVTRTSDTALSVALPASVGAARWLSLSTGYGTVSARGRVKVGY